MIMETVSRTENAKLTNEAALGITIVWLTYLHNRRVLEFFISFTGKTDTVIDLTVC